MSEDLKILEALRFEVKIKIKSYISNLIRKSIPLEILIEMLGYNSEEFIDIETNRRKAAGPVKHLKIDKLVDTLVADILSKNTVTLPVELRYVDEVLLPPDHTEKTILSGDGTSIEKEIISRTSYVVDVLSELKLSYEVITGKIDPNMMRKKGYFIYVIKEKNIIIFVNNEEGNATRIVWSPEPFSEDTIRKLIVQTKSELDTSNDFEVEKIVYPGNEKSYKEIIKNRLEQGFSKGIAERNYNKEEIVSDIPEGWFTVFGMSKKFQVSRGLIESILIQLGVKSELAIKGLNYYSPQIIKRVIDKLPPKVSEGWITLENIMGVVGMNRDWIKKTLKKEGLESTFYLGPSGKEGEYWHVDVIDILNRKKAELGEPAPQGWENITSLIQKLNSTDTLVRSCVQKYKKLFPGMFHFYIHPIVRRSVEFFHPDIVKAITEEIKARGEVAPSGWIAFLDLARKYEVDDITVRRKSEEFIQEHPEWIAEYLHPQHNKLSTFCHPELVKKLDEVFNTRGESAPNGWFTKNTLAKKYKVDPHTVGDIAKNYREQRSEWFKYYLNIQNQSAEHYHPDLVLEIEKNLGEFAPNGWMTNRVLAQLLERAHNTVSKRAEAYRLSNPEWFQSFRIASGQIQEHYSPELVEKVGIQFLDWEFAPSGWYSVTKLARELSGAADFIKKLAEEKRTIHPEWFQSFKSRSGNGMTEYYHPDLCLAIREKYQKIRDAR